MNERRIDVGRVSLAIAESGEGGKPLLLVHGFTGAKEDFTEWLDTLARDGWHAVAPDLRGHGASDKPDQVDDYSIAILSADVIALADALWGEGTPFTLLGHSMGGMVAQTIAIQGGSRLRGLVLMDTGHGRLDLGNPDDIRKAASIASERGMERLHELLEAQRGPLSTPADERLRAERPGYIEFGARKFLDTSPVLYEAMLLAMLEADDRLDGLRSVDVLTLVIVGEQDTPFINPSHRMADAIDGAQLAVIPDAGHSPQFENADGWWAALSPFLASVLVSVRS